MYDIEVSFNEKTSIFEGIYFICYNVYMWNVGIATGELVFYFSPEAYECKFSNANSWLDQNAIAQMEFKYASEIPLCQRCACT